MCERNCERKKIKMASALIIMLIITIAIIAHHHKKNNTLSLQNTMQPVPVRTQKPIQQTLPITANATGSLVADKSTIITPQASGYIQSISFHEGQTVKSGQTLFQLDTQTQQDALAAAQAAYSLSKLQYDRDKQFLKKGFITQDTFYTAKMTLKQNQAALQTAETNLSDRTITAPFDGMLGALPVSLGDYVNPGNTLTTLVDNKHLRVEYSLPVTDLNQLQLNQTVTVTDTTKKNKITATVSYIAPAVDPTTQTISVHARIDNSAGLFKPGEYVTVTQNLGTQKNTLLVPDQSVLASINGYHVFIVKNNKAIKAPVKMGDRINSNVIITSGLTPNDAVIVAGENEVRSNQEVSVSSGRIKP